MARAWILCLTVPWIALLSACSHDQVDTTREPGGSRSHTAQLTRPLLVIDTLRLTENDTALNVQVYPRPDPHGGILVADAEEAQVRRYSDAGDLLSAFGRRGVGPHELRSPVAAVRLSSGDLLVTDYQFKALVYSARGDTVIHELAHPFFPVYDLDVLDDSLVLFSARLPGAYERLHVFDVHRDTVIASFFVPPVAREMESAARTVGITAAAVRHDTIAAVFALSDSIFFFLTSGHRAGAVATGSQNFRPLATPPPVGPDSRGRMPNWVASFSMMSDIAWLTDGRFVLQYQDRQNMLPRWRLLGMRADLTVAFELMDTPRFLTVHGDGERLLFEEPTGLSPNKWLVVEWER